MKVIDKNIFENIEELLKMYDSNNIMPNHTAKELKELLTEIYGEELATKKLVAFKFEYISSDKEKSYEGNFY